MRSLIRPVLSASVVTDLRHPSFEIESAFGGRVTASGQTVSEKTASGVSAYIAAIRVIAEDLAKLPLHIYRHRPTRGRDMATDHPVYALLRSRPSPQHTSYTFRRDLQQNACGWGNGYAEIQRNGSGRPVALWPIHPSRVRGETVDGERFYKVAMEGGGIPDVLLPQRDMLHVRGLGSDSTGWSVLAMMAQTLGTALAAQEFAGTFFGNRASPGGLLIHPNKISKEAQTRLREKMAEIHSGAANAHRLMILEEGMEYVPMMIPPEQAQFLETRKFETREIARWFRVAPHKIADLDNATFTNIESQSRDHWSDALQPWAVQWEQELEWKLLDNDPDLSVQHQTGALLQGDSAARGNFYRMMFAAGAMRPNEMRDLENMNPLGAEGDATYAQVNIAPLERIAAGDVSTSTTAAAPGPETASAIADPRPVVTDGVTRLVTKEKHAYREAAGKDDRPQRLRRFYSRIADEYYELSNMLAAAFDCAAEPIAAVFGEYIRNAAGNIGTHSPELEKLIEDTCDAINSQR